MHDAPASLASALADQYRIERELGAGGMATVYLAHDLKHDRKVAIKVLRPELASAVGAERFLAEIRIAARLQHPHILGLIDSGSVPALPRNPGRDPGHPERSQGSLLYYVMPFIEGESLRDRLTRESPLPIDDAVRIASEVGSALDYAHRHNVIHRDIKPENILLHEGSVLVADFGIALALQGASTERLTETGVSIGTPQYMSPEQASGERNPDARSDIYSLGSVLYEMLAGEPPFGAPTAHAVLAKVMTQRPTPLRVVRDAVPPGLDAAVAKALEKFPADRFANAAGMIAAIHSGPALRMRLAVSAVTRRIATGIFTGAILLAIALRWRHPAASTRVTPVPMAAQLTFTGNANVPSLSPDGSRIAYVAQECDSAGACLDAITIGDATGAAALIVARRQGGIEDVEWTDDGRSLLFTEWSNRTAAVYVVSTLGGQPRLLGCCIGSLLSGGDTALVVDLAAIDPDSARFIRLVTLADGVARDSIRLPRGIATGPWNYVWGSPDGRRIAMQQATDSLWILFIIDRAGRVLDSLSHPWYDSFTIRWAPAGDAILATMGHEDRPVFDLLRFPVSQAGRIGRQPDTLLRETPMSDGHVRVGRAGGLVYSTATSDRAIYTVELPRTPASRPRYRRLAVGTGRLSAFVNAAGSEVLIERSVGTGGLVALSIMPFDSGATTQVGTPISNIVHSVWAPGAGRILIAVRHGDTVAVSEMDRVSGRLSQLGTVPAHAASVTLAGLPGGGALAQVASFSGSEICDLYLVGVPGVTNKALRAPSGCSTAVSSDGRAALALASDADTARLVIVSLDDGRITPMTILPAVIWPIQWLANGAILLTKPDFKRDSELYRIDAPGAAPQLLGRFRPGYYSASADGQRIVASMAEPRRDVYLVDSFKDLLGRKD